MAKKATETPNTDAATEEAKKESDVDEELDRIAAEVEAGERAVPTDDLPSSGLLSFYDRLRERIEAWAEEQGGTTSRKVVDALLLVPDVFMLLVRLMLDPDVPKQTRMALGGAVAYFVLPFDVMPEALLGAGGFMDDLVLAAVVLSQAFDERLDPIARRHWSGRKEVRTVIADVVTTAETLLGENLYARLKKLLKKRGIRVEE